MRCGAYDIFQEEQSGVSERESKNFVEQDIDSILARRTKTFIHDNTGSKSNVAGGTFSKASFSAKAGVGTPSKEVEVDLDDPDFWTKIVGESEGTDANDIIKSGKKRARKKANYNEKLINSELDTYIGSGSESEDFISDGDESVCSELEDNLTTDQLCEYNLGNDGILQNPLLQELSKHFREKYIVKERRRWGGSAQNEWAQVDTELVMTKLLKFGYKNICWADFVESFRKEAKNFYDKEEVSIEMQLMLIFLSQLYSSMMVYF